MNDYLVPRSMWGFPTLFEELEDDLLPATATISGLSISEDNNNVYVEAAVPGIDPKNVDVTFEKGILTIRGEKEEEEKKKKYFRKASSSFSYRVLVPGEVDTNKEPKAEAKNGVMTVTFAKAPKSQPKKIVVKTG
ncbi:MAG: Hsp20/alpha crystallin family protein [Candidatus Curtissbacteria bacterium]|nr:Hsp20/alpha crystallin family protein [Candidatus Curtissbacteria bacterium]